MDLFDLNDNFSSKNDDMLEFSENNKVLIWEKKNRKINTYATIPMDKEILKEYLKILKKKWCCNGSFKMGKVFGRVYDNTGIVNKSTGRNIKEYVFHLSKNCADDLAKFLKEKGVNSDMIEIKKL